jgi:AraC-like DNA-binding protein
MARSAIIDRWHTSHLALAEARVFPDGCRDVIWICLPGQVPKWKLSSLDLSLRVVQGAAGAELRGFRLAPGTEVDLAALFAGLHPDQPDRAEAAIAGAVHLPADTMAMLQAFREDPALSGAAQARRLGISQRSLQRLSLAHTGQPPLFWLRLIRLRQALAAARDGTPLAEAAADAGYADQAHFTREARRFHGAPPGRLLRDPQALQLILCQGL